MSSFHDLKIGETLRLVGNGQVAVTLRYKSGQRARLEIQADGNIAILPEGEDAVVIRTMPSNASRRSLILQTG
jgi:hypothetical protein